MELKVGKDIIEQPGKDDLVNELVEEPKTWGAMTDVEKGDLLLSRYWTSKIPDSNAWHPDWYSRVKEVMANQVVKPTLDDKTVTIDEVE